MKKKFVLSLYPLNASPKQRTWQICDMYGPLENNNQAVDFLNKVDPQGRAIKNALVIEGELISAENRTLIKRTSMLTTR
ncbi:MAG: hypothetical protein WC410_00370 [Candidatus Paceibacterota bacterium]|jgi:hypothetical protein|nr:hypothetical protein [Candidatus Paceibacterota bacterium]MDD5555406.1 hypothetical protein [Candidatus Paceibacterota bacterium]